MQSVVVVVKSVDGNMAVVEAEVAGCGRCHDTGGCGGKNISRALCSTPKVFSIPNSLNAHPGERVRLGVAGGAVRGAASRAYLTPWLLLLSGAGLGGVIGPVFSVVGALAGLGMGWFLLTREENASTPPQMLERLSDV